MPTGSAVWTGLGPRALLYENDAFHEGLLTMPHVPRSLNFFSADGDYGFLPFEGPTGIKAAHEQHILDKLAPNQSAFVIPGTYECDGPKMEAPSGSYWGCVTGNRLPTVHMMHLSPPSWTSLWPGLQPSRASRGSMPGTTTTAV